MKKILNTFLAKIEKIDLADLVSKDWLLKFISLVLAIGLWYFVGGENRVDKNVMIPIEIINLPRNLVISNQFKKEIEVTVSGPRSLILEMSNRAITRQVDLSSATPGTMVIENDNDHIPVPRGITVQRVQPSSIILSLDKLVQKQFPISARTIGKVADGYYVKSLKMDPDVITIAGPFTVLSQFNELYTRAINLDGMKQSVQLQVPLELEPAIVDLIGETSVTAEINIGLETVAKTLDNLPVNVVIDGIKRDVNPETVRVTANFPRILLEHKVDPKSLIMVTAIQQVGDDELKVKVVPRTDVELPIEILSIIPDTVSLADGKAKSGDRISSSSHRFQSKDAGKISTDPNTTIKNSTINNGDTGKKKNQKISAPELIKSQKSKRKMVK